MFGWNHNLPSKQEFLMNFRHGHERSLSTHETRWSRKSESCHTEEVCQLTSACALPMWRPARADIGLATHTESQAAIKRRYKIAAKYLTTKVCQLHHWALSHWTIATTVLVESKDVIFKLGQFYKIWRLIAVITPKKVQHTDIDMYYI